jgi:hypothetical protein
MPTRLPIQKPRKLPKRNAFMISFETDDPTIEEIRVIVRNHLFTTTDAIHCAERLLNIPFGVSIKSVRACKLKE